MIHKQVLSLPINIWYQSPLWLFKMFLILRYLQTIKSATLRMPSTSIPNCDIDSFHRVYQISQIKNNLMTHKSMNYFYLFSIECIFHRTHRWVRMLRWHVPSPSNRTYEHHNLSESRCCFYCLFLRNNRFTQGSHSHSFWFHSRNFALEVTPNFYQPALRVGTLLGFLKGSLGALTLRTSEAWRNSRSHRVTCVHYTVVFSAFNTKLPIMAMLESKDFTATKTVTPSLAQPDDHWINSLTLVLMI